MFPFANYRKGFAHLRIIQCNPLRFIFNTYKIWIGQFRHDNMYEFLVKDIYIKTSKMWPYQIGGDFIGMRKSLYLKVASFSIPIISTVH
jgi:hypothetical protein